VKLPELRIHFQHVNYCGLSRACWDSDQQREDPCRPGRPGGAVGAAGVDNVGSIGQLQNSGTIDGSEFAVISTGSIGPITNTGQIIGNVEINNQASVSITGGEGNTSAV
jgi:hypothetical protein